MAKLRVAIIACGSIAQSHARGWKAHEAVDIAALADTSTAALADFGEKYDVSAEHRYTDYREMLERERPDIVSVCSWHGQHAEMVVAAAARKPKAILCEKPMAPSLNEADAMIVACQRNNVKLAIGHMRRFYSGWEEARRLVANGAIGEPKRAWSVIREGLLNWGTHTIDGLRFVLGDPAASWVMGNVERKTDRYERATRIEDCCAGLIAFETGAQAVIESDLTQYGSINFAITGTEGMIEIDENVVRLFNAESNGWRTLDNSPNDPFIDQARSVVDWVSEREDTYRGEAIRARATLEILLSIYESARCHEVVRMPLRTRISPLDLMVESGDLPVERPGRYDIRSFLVRGEGMSWL